MLDPNEMYRLIVKALHEPDEEEYTTNQKQVIYEIRECDYIPSLLNYKALILCQPFHSAIGDMLNMIDTQIDYLQSLKLLHVLEEIQVEIEGLRALDINKKEHVYGYGCKLHEDDPEIIHKL